MTSFESLFISPIKQLTSTASIFVIPLALYFHIKSRKDKLTDPKGGRNKSLRNLLLTIPVFRITSDIAFIILAFGSLSMESSSRDGMVSVVVFRLFSWLRVLIFTTYPILFVATLVNLYKNNPLYKKLSNITYSSSVALPVAAFMLAGVLVFVGLLL